MKTIDINHKMKILKWFYNLMNIDIKIYQKGTVIKKPLGFIMTSERENLLSQEALPKALSSFM